MRLSENHVEPIGFAHVSFQAAFKVLSCCHPLKPPAQMLLREMFKREHGQTG